MTRRASGPFVALVLAPLYGLSGCGDDITNITSPEGGLTATVTGQVISSPSGAPVVGAEIQVVGRSVATTSQEAGVYLLEGMTAGTHTLSVSAPGHAGSRVRLAVDVSDPPDGPLHLNVAQGILLLESTASLEMTVLRGDDGMPAPGAVVEFSDWLFPAPASYGHSIDYESVPAGAVADAAGVVSASGLPVCSFRVTIRPYDADGDGTADFDAIVRSMVLYADETVESTIIVPVATGQTNLVLASITSYGTVAESPMFFVFSTLMDRQNGTEAYLQADESPYPVIPLTPVWTSDIRLEIPVPAGLSSDVTHDLYLTARNAAGRTYNWNFHNLRFTGSGSSTGDCPDLVTDVTLGAGQPPVDYRTINLSLEWTAVPCAGGYHIYAKDDRSNPDWVFLHLEPTDYEYGLVSTNVVLPPQFDRYQADGVQTPFAGTSVTLAVVPSAALEPDVDLGSHGTVFVSDVTPPSIRLPYQSGRGDNPRATPAPLAFGIAFSEFIHPSVADPVIEFQEAGGDPAFVLDPAGGNWQWEDGRLAGAFHFTLMPGQDASGDQYRIVVTDLTDFSGNVVPGQIATDWTTIDGAIGFFDFEDSDQGWTRVGPGWERGTPSIGPRGAHGGQNCWGTTLTENYGSGWDTTLTSPSLSIPLGLPILRFWAWYQTETCCDRVRVLIDDGVTQTEIAQYAGYGTSWYLREISLATWAGRDVQVLFRFTTNGSYNNEGFFLDDVEVANDR